MVWTYWAPPVLKELVYFSCGTPWTRNLVVVNTLSVDFMYMYKEMPASLHTGVWEDFCLLDKYSHWSTISMTDRTPCIPLCT